MSQWTVPLFAEAMAGSIFGYAVLGLRHHGAMWCGFMLVLGWIDRAFVLLHDCLQCVLHYSTCTFLVA